MAYGQNASFCDPLNVTGFIVSLQLEPWAYYFNIYVPGITGDDFNTEIHRP